MNPGLILTPPTGTRRESPSNLCRAPVLHRNRIHVAAAGPWMERSRMRRVLDDARALGKGTEAEAHRFPLRPQGLSTISNKSREVDETNATGSETKRVMSDESTPESGTSTQLEMQAQGPSASADPYVLEEADLNWVFCPGEQRMIAGCPPPSTCSPKFTIAKEWVRLTGKMKATQIYKPVDSVSATGGGAGEYSPVPRPADKQVLKQWVFQLVVERLWGPLREAEKQLTHDHPDKHCKLCCDHFDFAQPAEFSPPGGTVRAKPVLEAETILNKAFELLVRGNCGCGPQTTP